MLRALLRLYFGYLGRPPFLCFFMTWLPFRHLCSVPASLTRPSAPRWKSLSLPHCYISGVRTSINVCWMCGQSKYECLVATLSLLDRHKVNVIREMSCDKGFETGTTKGRAFTQVTECCWQVKNPWKYTLCMCAKRTQVVSRGQVPYFFKQFTQITRH